MSVRDPTLGTAESNHQNTGKDVQPVEPKAEHKAVGPLAVNSCGLAISHSNDLAKGDLAKVCW